jgi:hypothetical protein
LIHAALIHFVKIQAVCLGAIAMLKKYYPWQCLPSSEELLDSDKTPVDNELNLSSSFPKIEESTRLSLTELLPLLFSTETINVGT